MKLNEYVDVTLIKCHLTLNKQSKVLHIMQSHCESCHQCKERATSTFLSFSLPECVAHKWTEYQGATKHFQSIVPEQAECWRVAPAGPIVAWIHCSSCGVAQNRVRIGSWTDVRWVLVSWLVATAANVNRMRSVLALVLHVARALGQLLIDVGF